LCVPLLQSSQFQGAIEFFGHQSFEPDESTRQIHGAIATQITGFMGLLAQRSDLLDKLERLALTDDLTGLDNRRAWEAGLRREHAHARREGTQLSVAMLDLDQFKRYNDEHEHQAGDELLREVAERWSAHLRGSDILARYGGEEFALLFRAWPIDAALTVVERLRACMPDEQTCSAGLATLNGSETGEALVRRADDALYKPRNAAATASSSRPEHGGVLLPGRAAKQSGYALSARARHPGARAQPAARAHAAPARQRAAAASRRWRFACAPMGPATRASVPPASPP